MFRPPFIEGGSPPKIFLIFALIDLNLSSLAQMPR